MIFCGECGSPMNGETTRKKYDSGESVDYGYYVCREHRRLNKAGIQDKHTHLIVTLELIEDAVKEVIKDVIVNPGLRETIQKYVVELSVEKECHLQIKALKVRKKTAKSSISNLLGALEQGIYSDSVTERLKSLEQEVYTIDREISKLENISGEVTKKTDWMLECIHADKELTEADWRKLVEIFIKSVTCYSNGVVEICLNFYNRPIPDSQFFRVKVQKCINDYLKKQRKRAFRENSRCLHNPIG